MKVCFFGSYERSNYNMLLKKILEKQNVEVIECQEPVHNFRTIFSAYWNLWKKHKKINYDILIIPWKGIITLPLAKLICKKPIVYVAFISIYDTLVNDRKYFKKNSLVSKIIFQIEKLALKWSDAILTETNASRDYFISEFNIEQKKFHRVFLSADEDLFPKLKHKSPSDIFNILFFGSFIPLHGIDVIIKTASLLQPFSNIQFTFCGKGQLFEEMKLISQKYKLKNITFLGFVPQKTLREIMESSDLCLGIFDKGSKANNVVTNKVFQILSSGKPLLTMESNATREINLENKINCMLVPPNNPENLAECIVYLKNNPKLLEKIAHNGHDLFSNKLDMKHIGDVLINIFTKLA